MTATDSANPATQAAAPLAPTREEKYLYLRRRTAPLLFASSLSFALALWSALHFLLSNPALLFLAPYLAFTALYFLISLLVNLHRGGFRLRAHERITSKWVEHAAHASVDVLLPTCGEDMTALRNTWNGVRALCAAHAGTTVVYVLDDADRAEVGAVAARYGFHYSVRDPRGYYKKAGNLRHGYKLSGPLGHEFMCIFDADFRPRADFFSELLPYFYDDPTLGLVQSPQYFDVRAEQSWLQRGAGSVQEFFYRFSQVARQSHDAAICVGTNAIYRRDALDATGGTALIEHSEDVHTGFNMRMHGWGLRYVPLILAKGVCPDGMSAFFKQQYRWCMGSMSLLGSRKFWTVRMRLRQRLCYFTGFCYYIHTALTLFVAPLIPLYLLYAAPQEVMARNYLLLLPTTVYTFLIFPLWHRADFGAEAWAVKHAYSWAHLFAIIDVLRRRPMGWTPTGASGGGTGRYVAFRILQALFSFLPSVAWMTLAAQRVLLLHQVVFLPLLFAGLFATYTTGRVACYHERRDRSAAYHHAIDKPTELTHAVGRMERGEEPEKVEV